MRKCLMVTVFEKCSWWILWDINVTVSVELWLTNHDNHDNLKIWEVINNWLIV